MSGEGLCQTEGKASKCRDVRRMRLQEHQGFYLFSEIVYSFFITGGTYMTTKLGPKCSEKNKKNRKQNFCMSTSATFLKWR